jgi:hypothetical protein
VDQLTQTLTAAVHGYSDSMEDWLNTRLVQSGKIVASFALLGPTFN